jgi:hypothetical protein
MKQKLLVLLGAGSSLSQGMPKVSDIDRQMLQFSPTFIGLQQIDATGNHYPDVYSAVWHQLGSYLSTGSGPSLGLAPNFELALAEMITLSNWAKPAPFGSALQPSTSMPLPVPVLPGSEFAASLHVEGQIIHLLKNLADYMRGLSAALDSKSEAFQAYRSILNALRERFDVGIYNLNYDNVALTALADAYVGFDENGRFDAAEVQARREWGFIYHLHGSVHHTLQGLFANSMGWQKDLSGSFDDGNVGRSQNDASDGKTMPKTTFIAGGHKLDQLLPEPFQTLYSAFVRHVQSVETLALRGASFATRPARASSFRTDVVTRSPREATRRANSWPMPLLAPEINQCCVIGASANQPTFLRDAGLDE